MVNDLVSTVLNSLRNGKGAEIILNTPRHKNVRIVLIPSPLYSDKPNELLIASEGRGVHFYSGQGYLTYGRLISSGFPLEIAREVEQLVEIIMKQGRETAPITLRKKQQLSIPNGMEVK